MKYMVVKLDHFPEIGMKVKNLLYIYMYIYTSPPSLPLPLLPSAPTSFLSLLLDGLIVSGSLACRSPTGPWDVRIMAVRKGLCPPQTFSKKKCPENGPNPPQNKSRSESTRLVGESAVSFFQYSDLGVLRNGRGMNVSRALKDMKIESCKFTCESSCGSRTFDLYRNSKRFRFLMLHQIQVTQTHKNQSINCISYCIW